MFCKLIIISLLLVTLQGCKDSGGIRFNTRTMAFEEIPSAAQVAENKAKAEAKAKASGKGTDDYKVGRPSHPSAFDVQAAAYRKEAAYYTWQAEKAGKKGDKLLQKMMEQNAINALEGIETLRWTMEYDRKEYEKNNPPEEE